MKHKNILYLTAVLIAVIGGTMIAQNYSTVSETLNSINYIGGVLIGLALIIVGVIEYNDNYEKDK